MQRVDKEWLFASALFISASENLEIAKQLHEEAKNNLVDLTEEDAEGGGVSVKFTERRGTIDYKKIYDFVKPEIDVEQFRKHSSSVVNVNIVNEKP